MSEGVVVCVTGLGRNQLLVSQRTILIPPNSERKQTPSVQEKGNLICGKVCRNQQPNIFFPCQKVLFITLHLVGETARRLILYRTNIQYCLLERKEMEGQTCSLLYGLLLMKQMHTHSLLQTQLSPEPLTHHHCYYITAAHQFYTSNSSFTIQPPPSVSPHPSVYSYVLYLILPSSLPSPSPLLYIIYLPDTFLTTTTAIFFAHKPSSVYTSPTSNTTTVPTIISRTNGHPTSSFFSTPDIHTTILTQSPSLSQPLPLTPQ